MQMTQVELNARWYFWIALWFLLLAAERLFEFSEYFLADSSVGAPLAAAATGTGFAAGAVIWIVASWFLLRQLRVDSEQGARQGFPSISKLRPDDFVAQSLGRAGWISFLCLLLLMPIADLLARYTEITAESISKLWSAVPLGSFSLAYLILMRGREPGD